ncbi:MAG TPA: DUF5777 family beta-barrel protein [Chryseolinea sp.]|nr:DUF5777 family beta-barrel protein [Chryseolinea sp.]
MKKILILFAMLPCLTYAQDDLLSELEADTEKETVYTFATFKGTRLDNGHTIETKNAGSLEFIFAHRFGAINGGWYEMYGLDEALVRLGLDYGITDRLSVSIGRNSFDKTMDGYLKFRAVRQRTGASAFPFSVTTLVGGAYKFSPKNNSDVSDDFENIDRLSYTAQALIARKFSTNFSFQLMPTYIHKNAVVESEEENDQVALGLGGRIKLTKSLALTTEYYYNFSMKENSPYYNPLAFGIDIETGGHVFQLILTNAVGLTERAFITETRDDFWDGDIHFGFNVTRTFQLKKHK